MNSKYKVISIVFLLLLFISLIPFSDALCKCELDDGTGDDFSSKDYISEINIFISNLFKFSDDELRQGEFKVKAIGNQFSISYSINDKEQLLQNIPSDIYTKNALNDLRKRLRDEGSVSLGHPHNMIDNVADLEKELKEYKVLFYNIVPIKIGGYSALYFEAPDLLGWTECSYAVYKSFKSDSFVYTNFSDIKGNVDDALNLDSDEETEIVSIEYQDWHFDCFPFAVKEEAAWKKIYHLSPQTGNLVDVSECFPDFYDSLSKDYTEIYKDWLKNTNVGCRKRFQKDLIGKARTLSNKGKKLSRKPECNFSVELSKPKNDVAKYEEAIVVDIVDGDTLEVIYKKKKKQIRLIGIDTPEIELNEKLSHDATTWGIDSEKIIEMGKNAKKYVESSLELGDTIKLEFDDNGLQVDAFDRLLCYVYLKNGIFLNEELLKKGYARFFPKDWKNGTEFQEKKYHSTFQSLENEARKQGVGFWSIWNK